MNGAIPLPASVNTQRLVREYVQLEQLMAEYPGHELFVLVRKAPPAFALVVSVPKDVVHIQDALHPFLDLQTRVTVLEPIKES